MLGTSPSLLPLFPSSQVWVLLSPLSMLANVQDLEADKSENQGAQFKITDISSPPISSRSRFPLSSTGLSPKVGIWARGPEPACQGGEGRDHGEKSRYQLCHRQKLEMKLGSVFTFQLLFLLLVYRRWLIGKQIRYEVSHFVVSYFVVVLVSYVRK